jgi:hypothetical protein
VQCFLTHMANGDKVAIGCSRVAFHCFSLYGSSLAAFGLMLICGLFPTSFALYRPVQCA